MSQPRKLESFDPIWWEIVKKVGNDEVIEFPPCDERMALKMVQQMSAFRLTLEKEARIATDDQHREHLNAAYLNAVAVETTRRKTPAGQVVVTMRNRFNSGLSSLLRAAVAVGAKGNESAPANSVPSIPLPGLQTSQPAPETSPLVGAPVGPTPMDNLLKGTFGVES